MMDAGITALFTDNPDVKIVNTEGLCLNRQRSMVLSSLRARDMRNELKAVKTKKAASQKSVAASKGLLAAATAQMKSGEQAPITGPPPLGTFGCARGKCAPKPRNESWLGCPLPGGCNFWFCNSSKTCLDECKAHCAKHLAFHADPSNHYICLL
jgi:hypothetical protein